jgi:hypothetical protein
VSGKPEMVKVRLSRSGGGAKAGDEVLVDVDRAEELAANGLVTIVLDEKPAKG